MRLNHRATFSLLAGVVGIVAVLAVACGGDDSLQRPFYSGNSIYLEEREGGPVLVYEISIIDEDGDPYTKGVLVEGTAFTPGSVFSVVATNRSGKAQFIIETSIAGEYRVAIESFTDTEGRAYLPSPDNTDLGGKVVLIHRYEP